MRKERARIELQRIVVEYFKPLMAKVCAQKIGQTRVFFNRKNARAFLEDESGQRA